MFRFGLPGIALAYFLNWLFAQHFWGVLTHILVIWVVVVLVLQSVEKYRHALYEIETEEAK